MKIQSIKIWLLLLFLQPVLSLSAEATFQVLIVHAYNQEYPWTKSQHTGFVERLLKQSEAEFNFSVEYLDTKRINYDEKYAAKLQQFFLEKYPVYKPDLIYVTDDNGYLFARDVLTQQFRDSPIFFSGVNNFDKAEEAYNFNIRGVFEKKEIAQNLLLFKELQTGQSEVLIIGDKSSTYQAIKQEIKSELSRFTEIKPSFLSSENIESLIKGIKAFEGKHLFLTTIGEIKDSDGNSLTLGKIISEIIAVNNFAVISMEDAYLFDGVLGGYVTSGVSQGREAANLALDYLAGKPVRKIKHVIESPNEYIFDKSELDRLSIKLPKKIIDQAKLINIPPNFYERNSAVILGLIVILCIIIIAITALLTMARYKRRSELRAIEDKRSSRIERYQNALLDWSTIDFKNLNEAFRKATEVSAKTLQVSRVSIWLYNDAENQIECHDMFNDEQHFHGMVLKQSDFPQYFSYLNDARPLLINDARTHPATIEFSEVYLKPNNIYSMLDVPLYYQGRIVGVVCHEHTGDIRQWKTHEQDFATAIASAVSLSIEVDKRKIIEKHLEHQAYHDSLTGLPNRSLMMDRIDQAIKQSHRSNNLFALLFLDLDNFKHINDSFGHAVGDEVLKEIALRLRSSLREVDTIARLGGDEFTLLVSGFENIVEINEVASKLFEILQKPIFIDERELYVTSSIGISVYPNDGANAESLIQSADTAMYRAKEEGRNGFQFYTRDMTERAYERVVMVSALKRALENDEFKVFFQPQITVSKPSKLGLEALVRWQHPELGLLTPAKFIVAAEESGLIVMIDRWVMRQSLLQLKNWKKSGLQIEKLSLNLAVQQLEQPDILDFLIQTIKDTECEGHWLCLEVTESQIMKNPEKSVSLLEKISELGIKISIDDYGTGYSSLSYLKKLPVDELKIDRTFVRDIPENEDDVAIVRSVIALAKSMKIDVIAEGVETIEQLNFLRRENCSQIQGYLISQPKEADEITQLLKNNDFSEFRG